MAETFYHLTEDHIGLFLVQLLLLLGMARGLGALCRRFGQPALLGEILTGVILGPTLLGRVAPGVRAMLFPADAIQYAILDTVSWIGLLLLLLSAGIEVDVSVAWRRRGDALKIAFMDIILPMLIAFVPALLLPEKYLAAPEKRLLFAFFIATAMTISELPLTLKALHDLNLIKSDLGLLAVSALTVNDLIGWVIFTLILGVATPAEIGLGQVGAVLGGVLLYAAFCLLLGRRWVGAVLGRVQKSRHADAGMVLTIVCCLGALSGAITQWMGIHALFGLFLAGIMAGGTPALSERTRHVIEQMVHAVFVPVFFASIGLKVDFVGRFRWLPVLVLTVVGVGGRYYGAWVGARMTRLSRWDRVSIAIAHTPGGSMAMVVGLIAFEFGVITQEILVAIVFSSLLSSLLLGPWLAWSIRRRGGINLLDVLEREAICLDMASEQRWDAIRTLSDALARLPGMAPAETIAREVRLREEAAGTAVGQEMAFPHARMDGLDRAVVAFGRETGGIEWNAPDGVPVHLVFLILTPKTQDETQVQILSALARGLASEDLRRRLRETSDSDAAWAILREAAAKAATQTE